MDYSDFEFEELLIMNKEMMRRKKEKINQNKSIRQQLTSQYKNDKDVIELLDRLVEISAKAVTECKSSNLLFINIGEDSEGIDVTLPYPYLRQSFSWNEKGILPVKDETKKYVLRCLLADMIVKRINSLNICGINATLDVEHDYLTGVKVNINIQPQGREL